MRTGLGRRDVVVVGVLQQQRDGHLPAVGEAIAARAGPKVLILNGGQDRETGDMSAAGGVMAVVLLVCVGVGVVRACECCSIICDS